MKFIPGPPNTDTNQMDLHDNLMITALQNRAAYWARDPNEPRDEGVLIWDISDPVNPEQLSRWKTGGTGTHRDGYPGGKYANLAAGMPGYKANPGVPRRQRSHAIPKKQAAGGCRDRKRASRRCRPIYGSTGRPFIDGDSAYLGYSPGS